MSGSINTTSGGLSVYTSTTINQDVAAPLPPQPEPVAVAPTIIQPDSATVLTTAPASIELGDLPEDIQPYVDQPQQQDPPDDPKDADGPKKHHPTAGTQPEHERHHFKSTGDPHDTTLNGKHFDDEGKGKKVTGTEVYLKSKSGDFELQARRDHVAGRRDGVMFNTAAAVRSGNNVVSYDVREKGGPLKINGKHVDLSDPSTFPKGATKIKGGLELADGTTVVKDGMDVTIKTPEHDTVHIADEGPFINLTGSTSRDMSGVLGNVGSKGETSEERIKANEVPDGKSLLDVGANGLPVGMANGQLANLDSFLFGEDSKAKG